MDAVDVQLLLRFMGYLNSALVFESAAKDRRVVADDLQAARPVRIIAVEDFNSFNPRLLLSVCNFLKDR